MAVEVEDKAPTASEFRISRFPCNVPATSLIFPNVETQSHVSTRFFQVYVVI